MSCVRASRASSSDDAGGTGIAWKIHLRCCVPIVAQPAERPPKRTTTAATSVSRRGFDTNALAASGSMTFVTTFFTVFGVVLHPCRVFSDNARTRRRVEWAHRNQMLHSKSRAMSTTTRRLVGLAAIVFAAHASAQVTFYEGEGFRGRTFQANSRIWNFERFGFNDRASSVVVDRGRWEVCEDAGFHGRCVVLRRGSYDSLRAMGLNNQISSVRPVDNNRQAYRAEEPVPAPVPAYEWRRRPNERLIEVPVTSVRAVMGPPEQRCWVERQAVAEPSRDLNVPGAVIGGVVGGILGHQIGGG